MNQTAPDMKLRISVSLRQRIEEAAKRNNRTMNGEITARLEQSFQVEEVQSGMDATRRILQWGLPDEMTNADRILELETRLVRLEQQLKHTKSVT